MEIVREEKKCRVCHKGVQELVFELAPTPFEDEFVLVDELAREQPVFPLNLVLCSNCGYLYLSHTVSADVSYLKYLYESKVTLGLVSHYVEYAKAIVDEFSIQNGSLVIDLGSNDGSMLLAFKELGLRVIGVEPAQAIAASANARGVQTISAYFTPELAVNIADANGYASIITANYMFANIDDLHAFLTGVRNALDPNGIFVVQTGYHPLQMQQKMFDYIYHEHYSYFSLKVLCELFRLNGLEVIDATLHPVKGGSIRVVAKHLGSSRRANERIDLILQHEIEQHIHEAEFYVEFSRIIDRARQELRAMLDELKANGSRIVGYGASHSTTTLIYHFGLSDYLDYLVDDNPAKHGRYSPGFHLPVVSSSQLSEDMPNYVLILAWPYYEAIVARNAKYIQGGGKFIVPLPNLRII